MIRDMADIIRKIKSISIVKKIMIGYICVIVLPVVTFGFYYYNQISRLLVNKIEINHRQMMEQAYNNLKIQLAQYESLYKFVQANPFIVNYLDGVYKTDDESVYNYLSDIDPQLLYLISGNKDITDIVIYKYKKNVLHIPNRIVDVSNLDIRVRQKVGQLGPNKGAWLYQMNGDNLIALNYYRVIYNTNYTNRIGIIELKVSPHVLQGFLTALRADSNWQVYLLNHQGKALRPVSTAAESGANIHEVLTSAEPPPSRRPKIVNKLSLPKIGLNVVAYGKKNVMFQSIKMKERYLAILLILLLLLLSFAYNMLASSVAKRLSRLARHMRSVGDNNLRVYPKLGDMDEIGFLTSSYNAMVKRIEELIDNVHRAEVLRKEAAYRALQAQVNPHFLYNTLETIRMMALARNVPEVAEITYAFGRLMRYGLSSSHEDTNFGQEFEMIQSYLDIHRVRKKNRLQYKIDGLDIVKNVKCPRFILQPIVENCIVHGISKVRRQAMIRIAVSENGQCYIVTVEDNGRGIGEADLIKLRKALNGLSEFSRTGRRSSLGLCNVAERIRYYYGKQSHLEIDSEEGTGTRICMVLNKKGDEVDDEAHDCR